jgi:AraC-like DNA-binding protein
MLIESRSRRWVEVHHRIQDLLEKAVGFECSYMPVGETHRFLNVHEREYYIKLHRFFTLKGHLDSRDRYHAVHVAEAARTRHTVAGRQFGFADLFTPVQEDGRVVGFLVAGPFVEKPLTTAALEQAWVEIAGSAPEPFDTDYASFVRSALYAQILEPPARRLVEQALEAIAEFITGTEDARACRALDRIGQKLSRVHTRRSATLANPLIEPHTSRMYGTRLFAEDRHQLGVEHTPNVALVLMARPSPSAGTFEHQARARALFHAASRLRAKMPDLVVGAMGLTGAVALYHVDDRRSLGARRRELVRRAAAIAEAAGREVGVATLAGVAGATSPPQLLSTSYEQAMVALRSARATGTSLVRWEPEIVEEEAAAAPDAFDRLCEAFAHGERTDIELARLDFFRNAVLASAARADDVRTHVGYALHAILGDVARRGILAPRRFDELSGDLRRRIARETGVDSLDIAFRQAVSELAAICQRPADAERGAVAKRVLRYLDGHLDRIVTRAEVAKEAGLSPYHFSRLFRRVNGRGLRDELRARRLTRVAEMLEVTDLPVRQICASAGFRSYTAFFRVFRKAYGETPAEYRRARRRWGAG